MGRFMTFAIWSIALTVLAGVFGLFVLGAAITHFGEWLTP